MTVSFVFLYLFAITFFPIQIAKDVLPEVLIAIVAFGKDVYNFVFGSSASSTKKDEVISNALDQAQQLP